MTTRFLQSPSSNGTRPLARPMYRYTDFDRRHVGARAADVMDLLAEVDMHGIQTSGNCIRNIAADALAGIAPSAWRPALTRAMSPASGHPTPASESHAHRHRSPRPQDPRLRRPSRPRRRAAARGQPKTTAATSSRPPAWASKAWSSPTSSRASGCPSRWRRWTPAGCIDPCRSHGVSIGSSVALPRRDSPSPSAPVSTTPTPG